LISSRTKFWFVTFVPKYLNSATFSKDLLSLCHDFALHPGDDTATYALFCIYFSLLMSEFLCFYGIYVIFQ
jgi:hypothetical protein